MSEFGDLIHGGARECDLDLPSPLIEKQAAFAGRLMEASSSLSLTSLDSPLELARELILDPLVAVDGSPARELLAADGARLADVGAGTGSPGVPWALSFPGLHLFPLESVSKKCVFLEGLLADLGIDDGSVLNGRAEDFGRSPEWRGSFDLAATKAVGSFETCLELALPLLKVGGSYLGLFGGETDVVAGGKALAELGGELRQNREYILPWNDRPRRLVIVEKIGRTPDKYPRRPGIPRRRPLT
jgi:16S rRNA (guanine527-N7)-methyltransferase